jgi:chloride channel protein, CIC family
MSPLPVPAAKAPLPTFYAYADGTARGAAEIMASEGLTTLTVIDRKTQQACGTISLSDLLRGRTRSVERENERLRLFNYVPPEQGGHN